MAEGARTGDGRTVEGDAVAVGAGVAPRVDLARAVGLAADGGVVAGEHLETSVPGIHAAGADSPGGGVAAWHPLFATRVRVEHWANALNQGATAAKNMLGAATPYERVPYFYSDQYDLGMEYSGYARRWDRVVFRGDPATRRFVAFWLDRGRVVAGMNANVWDVTDPIQALVRRGRPVDAGRLADPGIPLDEVAGAA